MGIRLGNLWDRVSASYWFVPSLMMASCVALAYATITLDRDIDTNGFGWVYSGGPEGARKVLSTIAGSMITVAGVVFSINIVALTVASQQFGPRLLRHYMRDRGNQVVFGTFLSTFLYCVVVLRTVRGASEGSEFIPNISITVGSILTLFSIGVLIYFIHHASAFIQAPNLIGAASKDLHAALDRLFPERLGGNGPAPDKVEADAALPAGFAAEAQTVKADRSGYIQAIDVDRVMRAAIKKECLLRLCSRPGDFVIEGAEIARVWPGERAVARMVNKALILGAQRTPHQDIAFSFDVLAEIAVRSLSLGINDPFTAATCLDRLAEALCRLAGRAIPSPLRYDAGGKLRVIAEPADFAGIAESVFARIWNYGKSTPAIVIRMLEAMALVAKCIRREEDRAVLLRAARMVHTGSQETIREASARQQVERLYQDVAESLRPR